MRKSVLLEFRNRLMTERSVLVARAARTLSERAVIDPSDLPDEIDQASTEYFHGMDMRMRDREKYYLGKINRALQKIDSGNFGICEECGGKISPKRLDARPVTTLCIICKEDQEREERSYGG